MPRPRCCAWRGLARPRPASTVAFEAGDAHQLGVPRSGVRRAVSLRVLMHTPDWRQCLAELCRVTRDRVVFDYPALVQRGGAPGGRPGASARRAGVACEAYRVFTLGRDRRDVPRTRGFRVARAPPAVRAADRAAQAIGSRASTERVEEALRGVGLLRLPAVAGHRRGGAMRVLVTGATGFTGGHLARRALPAAAIACARSCAARTRRRGADRWPRARDGVRSHGRLCATPASLDRAVARRRGRLQHRGAVPAGGPAARRPTARSTPRRVANARRGRRRGRRRGGSSTAAPWACTATSSIRRRTRTRRSARRRLSGNEGRGGAPGARGGGAQPASSSSIARPTGIYGPGDRRLLKLFRGVARRRFVILGSARSSTISPTSTISSRASGCAARCRRPRAAPTSWRAAR